MTFSAGGMIDRGDKILDVVPYEESLMIEAQIGVDDISEEHRDGKFHTLTIAN